MGHGSKVVQTQNVTFKMLRDMVSQHTDVRNDQEKSNIERTLDTLEKAAQEGTLTNKLVKKAMKALAKYGWLSAPLTEVLKHVFHLQ